MQSMFVSSTKRCPFLPNDDTILHYLARSDHLIAARAVLGTSRCRCTFNSQGQSPLHVAAQSSNANFARALVDHGHDCLLCLCDRQGRRALDLGNPEFTSLLHRLQDEATRANSPRFLAAAAAGRLEAAVLLLSSGVPIDFVDESGRSALSLAAENSHPDMVSWLLEQSANPLVGSPMRYAIRNDDLSTVSLLLGKMHSPNDADDTGATPLHYAVCDEFRPRVFRFLMRRGSDVNVGGVLPMLLTKLTPDIVRELADAKVPLNTPGSYSVAHIAARKRDNSLMHFALRFGGDANIRLDNTTPIELALTDSLPPQDDFIAFEEISALTVSDFERTFGCARLLLEFGASPDDALRRALDRKDQLVVFFLLLMGVGVRGHDAGPGSLIQQLIQFFTTNEKTRINDSLVENPALLQLAVTCSPPEVVAYLIEKGLDVDRIGDDGLRPIDLALSRCRFANVHVLLDYAVSVRAASIFVPSVLHTAACNKEMMFVDCPTNQFNYELVEEFVKYLVLTGEHIDVPDTSGWTALSLACQSKNFRFVEVLLRNHAKNEWHDSGSFFVNLIDASMTNIPNSFADKDLVIGQSKLLERSPPSKEFIANSPELPPETAIRLAALYLETRDVNEEVQKETNSTALHLACRKGLCALVRFLVLNGANPHALDHQSSSPIRDVLLACDVQVLKQLITDSLDFNVRGRKGRTSFSYACVNGNSEIFQLLTANGASVHTSDKNGKSPIYFACKSGNLAALDYLLTNANVFANHGDDLRRAPIHVATRYGHLQLVQKLWTYRGMDRIRDRAGDTALHYAVRFEHFEIIKFISQWNAKLATERNRNGETPLTVAAALMKKEIAGYFLSLGVRFRPSESYHALKGALDTGDRKFFAELRQFGLAVGIRHGKYSIVDYAVDTNKLDFLMSVVEVSELDFHDLTPFALGYITGNRQLVAQYCSLLQIRRPDDVLDEFIPNFIQTCRSPDTNRPLLRKLAKKRGKKLLPVKALVSRGISLPDPDLPAALWNAFDSQNFELVETLLELGADPNLRNQSGFRLLSLATKLHDSRFLNMLLQYGADPDKRNANDTKSSAVLEALSCNFIDSLMSLLDFGGNINSVDGRGRSGLTIAIQRKRTEMLELLLQSGANPSAVDRDGKTPLHWAAEARNYEACKVLLEYGSQLDITDNRGQQPLHIAMRLGERNIMQLMYGHGSRHDVT
jgi:serine/threonine-protein phosphatase 6 regulatory ankyrin repeat subunit B